MDISTYFCHQRSTVRMSEIDESLAIGFYCRNLKDFEALVEEIERITEKLECERLFWFEERRHEEGKGIEEFTSGDDFSMDDF